MFQLSGMEYGWSVQFDYTSMYSQGLKDIQLSDNLDYWRNNSYPIAFQNHHAGIIFTGERIRINGYGTGGIFGNGNAWYDAEEADTQPGRPMPFVFWNVSDVMVEHCEFSCELLYAQ